MRDAKQVEIQGMELFRGCSAPDVQWIASVADTVDVPAGRTIVTRDAGVREFIVVVRGVASSDDHAVALSPGAYVGHVGLLDPGRHGHTFRTDTATRLLVFSPGAFRGMIHRIPAVGRKVLAHVVTELRSDDQPSRSLRAVS